MITAKINDRVRDSKQLTKHFHTSMFVEFEENENNSNDIYAEFEALEKQSVTGDELVRRVCMHIDELFDVKERIKS